MYTWRRCRYKYKLQYVDNYAPFSGPGQNRGSAGHAALATWYGNGCTEEADELAMKSAAEVYNQYEINTGDDCSDYWELTELIIRRYFDWARMHESIEEIISLEQKFEVEIGGQRVIGYIDGVVRVGESLWLMEHKFNKRVSLGHIDLDPQMSLYLLAAYKLGIDVRGVLFNVIRVAEGGIAATEPVVRTKVYRNQEGLVAIEREVANQVTEMANFHTNGGFIYRNETKDCSWDCPFYGACLAINDDGNPEPVLRQFPIIPRVEEPIQEKAEE
jgi:hypothetical protein